VSPDYLGEMVAKATVAGSILDNFCILEAKFTDLEYFHTLNN
jgi:hypothetical protein